MSEKKDTVNETQINANKKKTWIISVKQYLLNSNAVSCLIAG